MHKLFLSVLLLTLAACSDGFDTSDVPEGHEIGDSISTGSGYNGTLRRYPAGWCNYAPFDQDHRDGGEISAYQTLMVMACASKAVTPISVDRKYVCERFEHVIGVSDEFRSFYRKNCGHHEFPGDLVGEGNADSSAYTKIYTAHERGEPIMLYSAQREEVDIFGYTEWKAEKDRLEAEKREQEAAERYNGAVMELERDIKQMAVNWDTHDTYKSHCGSSRDERLADLCNLAKQQIEQHKVNMEHDERVDDQAQEMYDELSAMITNKNDHKVPYDYDRVKELCDQVPELESQFVIKLEDNFIRAGYYFRKLKSLCENFPM